MTLSGLRLLPLIIAPESFIAVFRERRARNEASKHSGSKVRVVCVLQVESKAAVLLPVLWVCALHIASAFKLMGRAGYASILFINNSLP